MRTTTSHLTGLGFLVVLSACLMPAAVWAQTVTQSITLEPGWNSVWMEVEPLNNRSESVFSNLPIASVWARSERLSPVDFIQSASEEAFNEAGWQRWLPESREESFLNNLFVVQANRAYLIKSTNASPVVWNISGRPSLRRADWVPDAYNLRGLPVEPGAEPTFQEFFNSSPAHYDNGSGQLQTVYRLNSASGRWEQVTSADAMASGTAYWVFTQGPSDYVAPLDVDVALGDGLDFGSVLTELELVLENRSSSPVNALVTDLAGPTNSILSYYSFDPQLGGQWPALPSPLPEALDVAAEATLRLAVRRQDLPESTYESVLEVKDGAGTRLWIPVKAENPTVPVASEGVSAASVMPDPMAGLWIGSATLGAVSEAHSANPDNPTPTRSEFNLRLIVHVDASGQVRLLKEVIQMWRDGTFTNNANGGVEVDRPGEYVLLTDDTLIPFFTGATVRDGESVGRRLSTVGYDFPSSPGTNYVELVGTLEIGSSVSGTLTLPHDHPTNPFKHKYHPDHDNLNARFDGPAVEAFTTARLIQLDLLPSPPDGPAVPDFGYGEMGGSYSEVITGIHKNPIHVSGTFRLSRISLIQELNPSPIP